MRIITALAGLAAIILGITLTGCGGQASPPAASGSQVSACTDALESAIDQAAPGRHGSTVAITVPAACNGISRTQVQSIANQIASNYSQAQQFANAFSQAMNGIGAS